MAYELGHQAGKGPAKDELICGVRSGRVKDLHGLNFGRVTAATTVFDCIQCDTTRPRAMPKQSKPQSSIPPAQLIPGTKDPILSTGPPKDAEDWKVKNARAKELIMSTLVPGSEPWKIAEPLELASDIWKALEARYAPMDAQTIVEAMKAEADVSTEVESAESQRRREAQARATQEFYESMPSRDQRFLWALLHGGKEETNAWFYGTSVEN